MRAVTPFPRRINVEITNHCNQRCVLCPRLGLTRPLGMMARSLFEGIARECGQHETSLWLHFLGEPLLHPDALEMIRIAKQAGVSQVGMSTNGVTLAACTDALLDAGLDRLECSMDALDRDSYRAMRGRDHFARVVTGVEGLLARKRERGLDRPVTSIQFMRTPELEREIDAVVERWQPHLGPGDFVMTIDPASFGGAISARPRGPAGERPACNWLFESLMVLQDGAVTMCGADWDAQAPLGNLNEVSIAEIWHGPELNRRRLAHEQGRFGDVAPCGDCQDWRLADGSGYRNASREHTEKLAAGSGS